MPRRPSLLLLIAIALYVGLRGLVLFTAFDSVCLPNYELTLMGNLGHIAAQGWYGPPLHQYYDNSAGQLVIGLLAAPLYATLGPTYLALKLLPVLLGLGTLVLIWRFVDEVYDRRAAGIAAILFAMAPPTLTKYSMVAAGNHFENVFFQTLAFYLFYRMHTRGFSLGRAFVFAAATGFAIFFYLGSLLMAGALGMLHVLVRGPRRSLADLRGLVPGFVAGLAPLLWIAFHSEARPAAFLMTKFVDHGSRAARAFERAWDFLTTVLPRSARFVDLGPLTGETLGVLYAGAFALAWGVGAVALVRSCARVWSARGSPGSMDERGRLQALRSFPLIVYMPLFVVALAASEKLRFLYHAPPVEFASYRYLVPHFTFACPLMAVVGCELWGAPQRWRRYAGSALATALVLAGVNGLALVDWSFARTNVGARYDGFFLPHFNVVLKDPIVDPANGHIRWQEEPVIRGLADFPLPERRQAYLGVGHYLTWGRTRTSAKGAQQESSDAFALDELLSSYRRTDHADLARGIGTYLGQLVAPMGAGTPNRAATESGGEALQAHLERLAGSADPRARFVAEGLAFPFDYLLARRTRAHLTHLGSVDHFVPASLAGAWNRGRGMSCGALLRRRIADDLTALRRHARTVPAEFAGEFWFGVGWGLASALEVSAPPELDPWIPRKHRSALYEGYGAALRHCHGLRHDAPLSTELTAGLESPYQRRFERGLRWRGYPAYHELEP